MEIIEKALTVLTDGLKQGGAKTIALGTSTAAVALWTRVRAAIKARGVADPHGVTAAESGAQVDANALVELLQHLAQDVSSFGTIVYGDVHGDVIGRDKNVTSYGN